MIGQAVTSFPTLKLFPAGAKDKPVTYAGGEKTVEAIEAFLIANGVKLASGAGAEL